MDLLELGSRIKSVRKQQGFTLETLSEKIGISRNFLWEIEAGRKAPAISTLYNLGITLNISIDYLMGISSEKKSLNDKTFETERDLEISQIIKVLNNYGLKELSLITDVLNSFSKYLES